MKLRNPLGFSDIKDMLKDRIFKTRGLQFDNWLFGPESSRDFRETGPWGNLIRVHGEIAWQPNASILTESFYTINNTGGGGEHTTKQNYCTG